MTCEDAAVALSTVGLCGQVEPGGVELQDLFSYLLVDGVASIAVAINAPFCEWAQRTDPRLAAAIVDRLTFNAHILETGHDSYRLRHSRTRPKGTTPKA